MNTRRGQRYDIDKLVQAAQAVNPGNNERKSDENVWKPTVDKAGNGYAVIRFLPGPENSDLPWARYWDHGFKGPTGKWYIEKSLTTFEQKDPLGELNSRMWNSGSEADKETVRERKRRLHYVTNILVVSDPSAPQNEGKVFLYKFGKKIFDKIMDVMQPQFPDESPMNPFEVYSGADFALKIAQVSGYRNYDRSDFKSPAPLFNGDDEKIDELLSGLHSFDEWTDPKNYKTYEQLQTKLMDVLGESAPRQPMHITEPEPTYTSAPEPQMTQSAEEVDDSPVEEEDDVLSYFQKLANAD